MREYEETESRRIKGNEGSKRRRSEKEVREGVEVEVRENKVLGNEESGSSKSERK